jgi:FKBP-type peptidyl-prolyl cis-trans isomerase FkpA
MQKKMLVLALVAATSVIGACAKKDGEAANSANGELTTDGQKFGYSIGIDLGKSLKPVKDDVDIASLKAGLDDAINDVTPKLDDKQREEVKMTVAKKLQEKQVAEREAQSGKAKEAGEKFLAENAKKEGVKTTASGLQYEVLTEGKGAHPKASDTVTVHYKGTLLNGEEFDSSYSREQPVTFPLANVIPGWTEGVQLMTPGSKYKFYIPSALGYGERGAGVKIGPNETLVFEVELLSVGEPASEGAN